MPDPVRGGEAAGIPRAGSVGEAVQRLTQAFKAAGLETPELDARILVCEGAGVPREALLTSSGSMVDAEAQRRIESYRMRRLAREPVARIVGRRAFGGLMLELGPATLDPRPDTETLVDVALELVRQGAVPGGQAPRILDLGTGTGAILIAMLAELPHASGVGTDIVPEALAIARRNAERHGVAERGTFLRSDWLQDVTGQFDLIVSNPPYIASDEIDGLEPEVARYDPRLALDGGADGLAAYRVILEGAGRVLRPDGWVVLEVGAGAAQAVLDLCRAKALMPDGGPDGGPDAGGPGPTTILQGDHDVLQSEHGGDHIQKRAWNRGLYALPSVR